jgi:hypothetical protein
MHPHEFDTHSRLFDVTLENGPIDRYMNFTFSIVANSFLQAQTTAVKRANARLAAYKAAFEAGHFVGDDCGEPLSLVEFSPAHVVKMEVVRSQVAIFRHEK